MDCANGNKMPHSYKIMQTCTKFQYVLLPTLHLGSEEKLQGHPSEFASTEIEACYTNTREPKEIRMRI